MKATARRILAVLLAGVGALALAPAALGSITPSVTLDQSAGTRAGATLPLGMDLKFAPSANDSPRNMTLSLPPGLLADASIGGGACLRTHAALAKCRTGSGTVSATMAGLPVSLPLAFDLVAPPKRGDLAGLLVLVSIGGVQSQLGTPGEVTIRSSSDPRGVGLDIAFTNLPDSFSGVPTYVHELKSTFNGLRLPASCPAPPAQVHVVANSYHDAGMRSTDAPLHVTECSKLAYTAAFHVTAVKDSNDSGVRISTEVTQPAVPVQATSQSVKLTLPSRTLPPNFAAASPSILCANPSSGSCNSIGTASSTSPFYPTPLAGKVYLTGALGSNGLPTGPLGLAIAFPSPFALTIQGTVDLGSNSTTFHGLPDIPLTDLQVTLAGGPKAAFNAFCSPATGIATSTLTSQNGDRTLVVSSPFTVSGCGPGKPHGTRRPRIAAASVTGLARGLPALSFRLVAGANALKSFVVRLPRGLRFVTPAGRPRGVSVTGSSIKSIVLDHGHLVVTLRRGASKLTVKVRPRALAESRALKAAERHHRVPALKLKVAITDTAGKRTTATRQLSVSP